MSTADELERLVKLRDQGVLTEDEFQLQKSRVLAESMPAGAPDPTPATLRDIVVTTQPDYWGDDVTNREAETFAKELVNMVQRRWDVDALREGPQWLLQPHSEADAHAIEEFVSREWTRAVSNVVGGLSSVPGSPDPELVLAQPESDARATQDRLTEWTQAHDNTVRRMAEQKSSTWSEWLNSLDKVKSFGVILHCPRCGSDQLREIRSPKGIVVAGVFAPKTRVECKMCGNRAYKSALRRSQ